jgi:hypothetical protein
VKRVVADTNVIVSALQFGGKPKQLLDLAVDGHVVEYRFNASPNSCATFRNRAEAGPPKETTLRSLLPTTTARFQHRFLHAFFFGRLG